MRNTAAGRGSGSSGGGQGCGEEIEPRMDADKCEGGSGLSFFGRHEPVLVRRAFDRRMTAIARPQLLSVLGVLRSNRFSFCQPETLS